eukprot:TRINITY_DN13375_c0_g1_i2.p1 TRINITY_DN13375_c0_g1~~TRINITY_DN13375_c0_g1_i2.p1  ORF type:complete len:342 (-),score=19.13 TRINITY_DN13375_c0_g1_i2:88-1113(-)
MCIRDRLTSVSKSLSARSNFACTLTKPSIMSCVVPNVGEYGFYALRLVDADGDVLSDGHVMRIGVVEKPKVASAKLVDKRFVVVSLEKALDESVMGAIYCSTDKKGLKKGFALSARELACEFKEEHIGSACVNISVNYGYDLVSACLYTTLVYRTASVTGFAPTFLSYERSPSEIIFTGSSFESGRKYSMALKKQEIDYVSSCTYIDSASLSCPTRKSRFNASYEASISLYVDAALEFSGSIYVLKEIQVESIVPDSGPSTGGTLIALTVAGNGYVVVDVAGSVGVCYCPAHIGRSASQRVVIHYICRHKEVVGSSKVCGDAALPFNSGQQVEVSRNGQSD